MQPSIEERLCERMEAILMQIRARLLCNGMAPRWHIRYAHDILNDPERLPTIVVPLGEHEEAQYLSKLPALMAKVEEWDARCATAWESAPAAYQDMRLQLSEVLISLQYQPRLYGKLAQVREKPLLNRAREAVAAAATGAPSEEVIEIERTTRLKLTEFIAMENANAADVQRLTGLRQELARTYDVVALDIAQQHSGDEYTIGAARHGLYLATNYYDHRRGYSFPEYAQHWVERTIQRQQRE